MDELLNLLASRGMQNLLLSISAIFALVAVHQARDTARKRQSADLLLASRGDPKLQQGQRVLDSYHNARDKNIRSLALGEKDTVDEYNDLIYVLNHFETVSVGIQAGIYDEAMIKQCWCSLLISTFDQSRPLIEAMRAKSQRPTALQEFEWLAVRWKAAPLKPRSPSAK